MDLQALSTVEAVHEPLDFETFSLMELDDQLKKSHCSFNGQPFSQQKSDSDASHIYCPCKTTSIHACTLQESENPVSWHIADP